MKYINASTYLVDCSMLPLQEFDTLYMAVNLCYCEWSIATVTLIIEPYLSRMKSPKDVNTSRFSCTVCGCPSIVHSNTSIDTE